MRRLHILVAEVGDGERLLDVERPRRQDGAGVVRADAGVERLPLGPQPVDVAVMAPEDRVEGGHAGRHHVAELRLAVAVARVGAWLVVDVGAAREVVDQIVDVLQRAEVVVVGRAAAEGEEVAARQNAIDVVGRRIAFEDQALVAARPAQLVPERIDDAELGHDRVVAVLVLAVGDPGGGEQAQP